MNPHHAQGIHPISTSVTTKTTEFPGMVQVNATNTYPTGASTNYSVHMAQHEYLKTVADVNALVDEVPVAAAAPAIPTNQMAKTALITAIVRAKQQGSSFDLADATNRAKIKELIGTQAADELQEKFFHAIQHHHKEANVSATGPVVHHEPSSDTISVSAPVVGDPTAQKITVPHSELAGASENSVSATAHDAPVGNATVSSAFPNNVEQPTLEKPIIAAPTNVGTTSQVGAPQPNADVAVNAAPVVVEASVNEAPVGYNHGGFSAASSTGNTQGSWTQTVTTNKEVHSPHHGEHGNQHNTGTHPAHHLINPNVGRSIAG